jgi:hypothetical protein
MKAQRDARLAKILSERHRGKEKIPPWAARQEACSAFLQ